MTEPELSFPLNSYRHFVLFLRVRKSFHASQYSVNIG